MALFICLDISQLFPLKAQSQKIARLALHISSSDVFKADWCLLTLGSQVCKNIICEWGPTSVKTTAAVHGVVVRSLAFIHPVGERVWLREAVTACIMTWKTQQQLHTERESVTWFANGWKCTESARIMWTHIRKRQSCKNISIPNSFRHHKITTRLLQVTFGPRGELLLG